MTTAHWRQEVVDAAATISKSLGISLSFAGSMGTGSIGDGIVARSLETVSSLLGRGDEKWNSWFHDHISRPLAALFADPKPGLLSERLRDGHTKEEGQKRSDEIIGHRNKLWEPFLSIQEALDFFVSDFPRGLIPPQGQRGGKKESPSEPFDKPRTQNAKNGKPGRIPTVGPALEEALKGEVRCPTRKDRPKAKPTLEHWSEALVNVLRDRYKVESAPSTVRNLIKGRWEFDQAKEVDKGADKYWKFDPKRKGEGQKGTN